MDDQATTEAGPIDGREAGIRKAFAAIRAGVDAMERECLARAETATIHAEHDRPPRRSGGADGWARHEPGPKMTLRVDVDLEGGL